jgi:glycosyltransferase involved in cell wall biosynthesis
MYWLPVILIIPYFFLLLKIYRNLLKIIPFRVSSSPSTYVSIIIACRNGQDKIPALLECISMQDYPKILFEVIIVDDNSTDKTIETVSGKNIGAKFSVLKNNGNGKKEAIRTGIKASTGRLIITTDADCTMGKSWIKTIAAFYEINSPELIICPVQLDCGKGFFGRFQELEYMSLQGITAGTAMAGNGIMCNGANLAFERNTYLKHVENLRFGLPTGDDVFLLHSIKKELNSKIMWLESYDAIVYTSSSPTLSSFLKQRKRWISKWDAYDDRFTIMAAILTFVAIFLQLSVFVALFFNLSFMLPFFVILILKSIPDFLILKSTTLRYGKKRLMRWFLPAQLIYPFYVISVVLYSPAEGQEKSD